MTMNTKSVIEIALAFALTIALLATAPAVFAVESQDAATGSWYVAANRGSSQPTNSQIAFATRKVGARHDAAQLAVRSRSQGNPGFNAMGAGATRNDVAATARSGSTSTRSSRFDARSMEILQASTFTPQAGSDLFIDVAEYATALDGVRLSATSDLTAGSAPANTTVNRAGFNDNLIGNPTGRFNDGQFYRTPELFLLVLMLAGLAGLRFRGRRRKRGRARVRVRAMY
jgi:hypothetical protein